MNVNELELRYQPGSIGNATRSFVMSYADVGSRTASSAQEFNTTFHRVLINRENDYLKQKLEDGNLLVPTKEKGIAEIHRNFDSLTIGENTLYHMDLPTMILLVLVLESRKRRKFLLGLTQDSLMQCILIVYEETNKVCSYQSIFNKGEFIFNASRLLRLYFENLKRESFLAKTFIKAFSEKILENEKPILDTSNSDPSEKRFQAFLNDIDREKREFNAIYQHAPIDLLNIELMQILNRTAEFIPTSFIHKKIKEAVETLDYAMATKLALLLNNPPSEEDSKRDPFIRKLHKEANHNLFDIFHHSPKSIHLTFDLKFNSIRFSSDVKSTLFTRFDLMNQEHVSILLENYCETYSSEPRHAALKSVMERIETEFTKTLHQSHFTLKTFEKINDKLKPFLSKISDLDLLRRNIIYISLYSQIIQNTTRIPSEDFPELKRHWLKWLISHSAFKFVPVCQYLTKVYPHTFSKEKMESIKYLHQVISDELAYLKDPNIKSLFNVVETQILNLNHYSKLRTYRTIKISNFSKSEKEKMAFIYLYNFLTFSGNVNTQTIDLIVNIMVEEGIESECFEAIQTEMLSTGLF